ncbi:MAG: hypothetical protein ACXVQR_01150 [Solirubrobacteraceae bacterium]
MAIDCLPARTREAMLEGIRNNAIIVGGYTDGRGGVCPMLAAHRAGGRTNFIYFAKAWDRFANAEKRARRATERELLILTTHLEASLLDEAGPGPELAQAIAEHRELIGRRAEPEPRLGQHPERTPRPGRAWAPIHIFRRRDRVEPARAALTAREGELVGQS